MTWLIATYLLIETLFTAALNLVLTYTWFRTWRRWRREDPERADTAAGMVILLLGFWPVTLVRPLIVWSMLGWTGLDWNALRTVANYGGWLCVPVIILAAGTVTYRIIQWLRKLWTRMRTNE